MTQSKEMHAIAWVAGSCPLFYSCPKYYFIAKKFDGCVYTHVSSATKFSRSLSKKRFTGVVKQSKLYLEIHGLHVLVLYLF